ncbi:MAG: ATP-binding cassette domain-containing protein, partial [Chloroflexota bacterium]
DYAAQLRLPPDTTAEERARRIDEVLAEVRMEGHRDQVISRLSGGQRKRVSIAAELLAQPSVLFLDEPTSGLDPGLDKTVMGLLRLLCDKGRTIILVTHATENIGQCTLVAFMRRGGSLAYFGPPRDALAFFGVSSMPDVYTLLEQGDDSTARHQQRFQESPLYQRYILDRRQEAAALTVGAGAAPRAAGGLDLHGGVRQWGILSRRYAELLRRDRLNLLILLAQAPVVGLLLFLVVSSQSYTSAGLSGTQQVLLMLTLAAIWFGTINAAREIVKERPIYLRERLATLRVWPYILSKVAVLSLLSIGQSVVLLGIVSLKTPHLPAHGMLFPTWLEMAITLSLT